MDYFLLEYLTTLCWLKHLWSLLSASKLKLYFSTLYYPIFSFNNKKIIILIVIKLKVFTKVELYQLNTLQIFLQVIFISDLLQTNSNSIKLYYYIRERDSKATSKYK